MAFFCFRRILSCFAIICGFILSAVSQAPPANASLEGSVVNKVTGAPVKHAHVMYVKAGQPGGDSAYPRSTDTDADGRFAIALEPGAYRLWVERQGFSRQVYGAKTPQGSGTVLNVAAGQQMRDFDMRLVPLGAISGHVFDDDGDPVQGAGIQVLRFSYSTGHRQLIPVAGASSNDRGEYRAYDLPAGRYFLIATLRGIPMFHPPESGALVPEMQEPFAPLYYPGVLDFSSAAQITLPEGSELTDADFHLQRVRAATVRGRLLSPVENFADGQVQVVLAHNDGNAASSIDRASGTIDHATGRFEFRGVAPGSYLLVASQLQNGHPLGGRVQLDVTTATPQQNANVALTSAFDITGAVEVEQSAAAKLSNVVVRLSPSEGLAYGPMPASKIASDGSIHLAGITPGIWNFMLDSLPEGLWIKSATFGEADVTRGEINISSGSRGQLHIVLAANGAEVTGSVLEDGQPHAATVVLVPSVAEWQSSASMYRVVPAQHDGTFSFKGVRPGAYKLFAFEDVDAFAWMDPEFRKPVESLGEAISVSEGDHVTRQISPVPADALLPGR
ncbi:MAG TPA: carboxypeptidase regulatory-like domain-containing protein [Candidatus Angelobacter sp.]|nr:carboxypeptidase regulatory-like domain-containing protein [Candidatus Angelobacter sp.]